MLVFSGCRSDGDWRVLVQCSERFGHETDICFTLGFRSKLTGAAQSVLAQRGF